MCGRWGVWCGWRVVRATLATHPLHHTLTPATLTHSLTHSTPPHLSPSLTIPPHTNHSQPPHNHLLNPPGRPDLPQAPQAGRGYGGVGHRVRPGCGRGRVVRLRARRRGGVCGLGPSQGGVERVRERHQGGEGTWGGGVCDGRDGRARGGGLGVSERRGFGAWMLGRVLDGCVLVRCVDGCVWH